MSKPNTYALIMAPARQEKIVEPTAARTIFWRSPNFRLHFRYATEVLGLPEGRIFIATFLEGYELVDFNTPIPRKFNKVPTQREYPIWGQKIASLLSVSGCPKDMHLISLLNNKCSLAFNPAFVQYFTGALERPLEGKGILGMQMQWILQQLEEGHNEDPRTE